MPEIKFSDSLGGGKKEIYKLSVILTEKCTLRCKYCTEYMPDLAGIARHADTEICKEAVSRLLDATGELESLNIQGGEIFLHPQWADFVRWCVQEVRIRKVILLTNATVLPSEWEVMKNKKVLLALDDYGKFSWRLKELQACANEQGVQHTVYRHTHWFDVSGCENMHDQEEELCEMYAACQIKGCWNISDGLLYKCTTSYYKMKYKVHRHNPDTIDLLRLDTDGIRKAIQSLEKKNYLEACKYCAGTSNETMVGVAQQVGQEQ